MTGKLGLIYIRLNNKGFIEFFAPSSNPIKLRLVTLAVPVALILIIISKILLSEIIKDMQGPSPIPVFRPAKLSPGPEFQGSLVESPANVFYQKVTASRATLDRLQFQWRSVSDNLLVSPVVRIRFLLNINCPQLWTHLTSTIPLQGLAQLQVNGLATYPALAASNAGIGKVAPPCLVFADGDAFTSCCSSISLNFNGTSLSLNRTNRFWRDWQRTQLSSEDSARIYKRSGGSYDV